MAAWFDQVAAELSGAGLEVLRLEGVEDMVPALAGVDLAVSAAGGTAWELCALGLPTVLAPVAANQRPVAEELDRIGAARWLRDGSAPAVRVPGAALAMPPVGWAVEAVRQLATDEAARAELARRARAVVDGRGAVRVATRLRADLLSLRRATRDDARLLWEWANDPGTRAQSFVQDAIPWDRHVAWLDERVSDPDVAIYLAADDGGLVGQVRAAPVDRDAAGGGRVGPGDSAGV